MKGENSQSLNGLVSQSGGLFFVIRYGKNEKTQKKMTLLL